MGFLERPSVPEALVATLAMAAVSAWSHPQAIGGRIHGHLYGGGLGKTQSGACSQCLVGRQSAGCRASVAEDAGLTATRALRVKPGQANRGGMLLSRRRARASPGEKWLSRVFGTVTGWNRF
ncbi:hypothetical protein [Candidatus Methylacidithermus pantelleriae]|uniref:hypothetical protein n=1 Tax=Candidatus Methylacidithermus pantelleriae TaxID=2744239 RepID=UPI001BD68C9F|nr:hypothetical protein [Candidatus Methylacidithermus pantelleriae]